MYWVDDRSNRILYSDVFRGDCMTIYTCKGKGGEYELLGVAVGAGTNRGIEVVVYRDIRTGQLYHRSDADFHARMEKKQ